MLKVNYEIEVVLNSGDIKVEKFTVEHDMQAYMSENMESIDNQAIHLKFSQLKEVYGENIVMGNYSVQREIVGATPEDCTKIGATTCDRCFGFGMMKTRNDEYKVCNVCKGTGMVEGRVGDIIH